MQTTSELYKQILADPAHGKEIKLTIAGTEYGEDFLWSASTSGGIFDALCIGTCASRRISLQVLPQGTIPRQAEIKAFVRLVLGDQVSEWIPKGVFYISTREPDKKTDLLSIEGFDAMMKAETVWLDEGYAERSWPMAAETAAADIAARIGCELDPRTVLSEAFPVEYPVDEDGDMTMREILAEIAVANAGNWIITDAGKLLLVPLDSAPATTHYLVTEDGDAISFGGVRIVVG